MSGIFSYAKTPSKQAASLAARLANQVGQKAALNESTAFADRERDLTQNQLPVAPSWNWGNPPADPEVPRFQGGGKFRPQRKLVIGSTTDPLESEADAMADRVVRGQTLSVAGATSPAVLRRCACEGKGETCAECAGKKKNIQRRANGEAAQMEAPPLVHDVIRSPGQPLEGSLRHEMEEGLGFDFSRVRVHTGEIADASARAISAHAYTAGRNIVFANGQFSPSRSEGRRLIAHELAHVMQQSGSPDAGTVLRRKPVKVAQCGLLDVAGTVTDIGRIAHIQIQNYLAGRGIDKEFSISRGTKYQPGWGCRKLGTPFGSADLAKRNGPGYDLAEIKPISIPAVAKLEVGHYRRRAVQAMQRLYKQPGMCARRTPGPDDQFFATKYGLTPLSTFSRLSGVFAGDVTIGAYEGNPSLILKAKEVGAGAICYWCAKDDSKKSKDPKPPGPSVGLGITIGGSAGGAYNAGVGVSIQSDSTAYGTAGAGVSLKSDSKAAGVAGAGASMDSDSMAAGAAGAGASKDSQSIGAGVAGAGASTGSMSGGAGVAGAGTSEDSATAAAGVAGKGSVKDSAIASAGASGTGHVEGVAGAGTGSPGKPVEAKDSEVGGRAGAPAPAGAERSTQPGAATGAPAGQAQGGKEGQPGTSGGTSETHGEQDEKQGSGSGSGATHGSGTGGASGALPGGSESAAEKGAQGAKQTGPDAGSGGGPGADSGIGAQGAQRTTKGAGSGTEPGAKGGTGTTGAAQKDGAGTGTARVGGGFAVGPVAGPNASEADREKANAEAGKVAAMIAGASPGQKALFRYLAETAPNGRYVVPASQWVEIMMKATAGISEDDMKYLQSLNWKPAKITAEELRKKLQEALKTRKPPASADSASAGDSDKDKRNKEAKGDNSGGQGSKGQGHRTGGDARTGATKESKQGGDKGTREGPGLSGLVTPHKYTGDIKHVDDTGFQIQPDDRQIKTTTPKGTKVQLEIRWREGGMVKRAKVEYEIVSDPVLVSDSTLKKKRLSFSLRSTNTDPLELSEPGADHPTVLPAQAPGVYYIFTSGK